MRWAFLALGFVLLAVGITGVILPVMPGTIFLILALACFTKGSARMEAWMLAHERIGPSLRDWRNGRVMRPPAKVMALSLTWVGLGATAAAMRDLWWSIGLAGIAAALTIYVLSLPSWRPRCVPPEE